MELVRLQLAEPGWYEAWSPYWRSLPPQGALGGKEAFDLSVVNELQDATMARPCTQPEGSATMRCPLHESSERQTVSNMCATNRLHVPQHCALAAHAKMDVVVVW